MHISDTYILSIMQLQVTILLFQIYVKTYKICKIYTQKCFVFQTSN